MAKAQKNITVTLTLNPLEAGVLVKVLANVGGDPSRSFRKYTESIYLALGAADIEAVKADTKGSIYFEPFE